MPYFVHYLYCLYHIYNTTVQYSTSTPRRVRVIKYVRGRPAVERYIRAPRAYIKFREKYFRERGNNHEIHENIIPRKFGAIRYMYNILVHGKYGLYNTCFLFCTQGTVCTVHFK